MDYKYGLETHKLFEHSIHLSDRITVPFKKSPLLRFTILHFDQLGKTVYSLPDIQLDQN